ncbi:MAG: PIN domain-containing protein [Hyphomicrobium sp.]
MTVQFFIDTNILVYAASASPQEQTKRKKATDIIAAGDLGLSGQVLAEFYSVVTTKGKPPMSPVTASAWIDLLDVQPVVPVDANLVRRGIEISVRYQISYWDGAIIAATEALGAKTLYSVDLSHSQTYGDVEVRNPFL